MQAYCSDVVLVPRPYVGEGLAKRLLQLQSLASTRSCERRLAAVPEMQRAVDRVLRARRFDLVNLEFSFLGACDLRQAPPNERLPRLVVDSHNIDYELPGNMPALEKAWPAAFTPRPIGASCGGKSWGPTAMRMGSTFAARKTNGACST